MAPLVSTISPPPPRASKGISRFAQLDSLFLLFLFSSLHQFLLLGISFCDLSLYVLPFAISVHRSPSLSWKARVNHADIVVGQACLLLGLAILNMSFSSWSRCGSLSFPVYNCLILSAHGQFVGGGLIAAFCMAPRLWWAHRCFLILLIIWVMCQPQYCQNHVKSMSIHEDRWSQALDSINQSIDTSGVIGTHARTHAHSFFEM